MDGETPDTTAAQPAETSTPVAEAAAANETPLVEVKQPLDPEAALKAIEKDRLETERVRLVIWHDRVLKSREKLKKEEYIENELHEQLKQQRKRVETQTASLMEIIDERDQPSLFTQPLAAPDRSTGVVDTGEATKVPAIADAVVQKRWQDITVEELGFTKPSIPTLLADFGLKTLGDIVRHQNSGKDFAEIKGLGATKIKLIIDKVAEFEASHAHLGKLSELVDAADGGEPGKFPRLAEDSPAASNEPEPIVEAEPEIVDLTNGEPAEEPVATAAEESTAQNEAPQAPPLEASDNFTVLEVGQLNLKAGEICQKATMGLLLNTGAKYSDDAPAPEITNTVGDASQGQIYVVTQSLKSDDDIYAMRPLLAPGSMEPVPGDPFCHRRVRYEGTLYMIGPCDTSHFVRDA